ncbi:MAG: NAD-dependent succinate-semialdehyde dehydrogenase [Proteobacteria bacterium]|nr:NAD-dependent succinate-semialdehyde dehydrogenase [Pseudomonadota bacterium]
MAIQTINPATGEVIKNYSEMNWNEVEKIIHSNHQAFLKWSNKSFQERAELIRKVADNLGRNKQQYAELITQEMGKPIRFSVAEIEKCQKSCYYYADNAEKFLAAQPVATEKSKSYVIYKPLGIILAFMPWNYPFWQVFRFAAPTLMAGNSVLLRHAPISTGTGLAIEQLFRDSGCPENLFRTLIMDNDTAAVAIRHPLVKGVTLTGSPQAGSIVGANAVGSFKKVVLELGGSDPYLILEDADLEHAAKTCVASRLNNSGQVCIAAKRIIAVDAIKDKFETFLLEQIKNYKMGDPTHLETDLGPLARKDLRDNVHRQVQACIEQGATLVMGGAIPTKPGFFYPPTVLKNLTPNMPAMREEIFGPVLALITAKDQEQAINIANDTDYGLSAAVFTQDIAQGEDIAANRIHAGCCYVNDLVASDPRLPFGGIKHSGIGRELGVAGIHEFTNVKTICIK